MVMHPSTFAIARWFLVSYYNIENAAVKTNYGRYSPGEPGGAHHAGNQSRTTKLADDGQG